MLQCAASFILQLCPNSETPSPDNHENHPNYPIPPVLPYHPTASVDAPQQLYAVNFVLPPSDSCTNPGVMSGADSLQRIRENTQTVFQDQSTTEARSEPGGVPLYVPFNTFPSSPANAPRHSDAFPTGLQSAAVATGTGAPISPGSFGTEEREGVTHIKNLVEEPWELEHPQHLPSTTPPPRIYARSATGDHFRHAPGAPQSTPLEADHGIVEECQE
ncbi:uncharacterized protein BJ212DRAFT_200964 [Suillus subaureus]|uniref:Uncharacterized protein n=1 Tax=Suillus subaureus TaxID=48587 RepID=A0A9P7J174_9AGAM|nr:uncharacterized protein BJ212DRAFT_200964 [Suillus subaureus]KAG1798695.1 hypothetical protein BJ212DRAFT_200964 [Suillus subaureus]